MNYSNISTLVKQMLLKIHDDIYKKINQNYIDVFLCGGVSSSRNISVRDIIRKELEKKKGIRILYPEELFMEILNKDKESDLLSLEKFLADNCDIICIICESAGSLVELGAFTNNDATVGKVIAVIEEKRKKDKSFIMLGPIKVIERINNRNVFFYNKNKVEDLSNELSREIKLRRFRGVIKIETEQNKPLNTILGLYYILPLMLYFFKSLEYIELTNYLKYLFKIKGYDDSDFEWLFRSSLKLLYKDRYIYKTTVKEKTFYSLTQKGYNNIYNVLYSIDINNRTLLYDSIRLGIIKSAYY